MKIKKAASIPLVTHDPFFSIWSPADNLYDRHTMHWCGASNQLRGILIVDGIRYSFLGHGEKVGDIKQKSVDVTATSTEYVFENDKVVFKCKFTSPIIANDLLLVSRPCTYIDFEVEKKDAKDVSVIFEVRSDVVRQTPGKLTGFNGVHKDFGYSFMGKAVQSPLMGSDDTVAIDWGYAYLASSEKNANIRYDKLGEKLIIDANLDDKIPFGFVFAYDDLLSINYFGTWKKAFWAEHYATILDAISAAINDKKETLKKAEKFDKELEEKAHEIGGESYAYLCNLSYRQAVAAHKLIADENGEVIFLSKENDSNGCIGTVDVSYPSIPLFMLYNTEFVKGMLRPIFKFAACDVWEYDFAPHDVGRYPYAWGQAYAFKEKYDENKQTWAIGNNGVYPPFYMYPAGSDIYDFGHQMPVEECGNMLIMVVAVCKADGNADFAKPYWNVLKQWKNYLVEYGSDPGDQLCTDDFAGHLEHNVNLSAKAIMGIEAYAILAEMLGEEKEADEFHKIAKEMAADWEARAKADDHYMLAFGSPESWSLKYNLVWDRMWGCNLFSEEVYETELAYYIKKTNEYGTPLDNRSSYTKSDWILWCASMAKDKQQAEQLIKPVANYLENSISRVPFSDWYFTDSGKYCRFIARSVQGGIFMPMYFEKAKKN